jgi:hypothetical protein
VRDHERELAVLVTVLLSSEEVSRLDALMRLSPIGRGRLTEFDNMIGGPSMEVLVGDRRTRPMPAPNPSRPLASLGSLVQYLRRTPSPIAPELEQLRRFALVANEAKHVFEPSDGGPRFSFASAFRAYACARRLGMRVYSAARIEPFWEDSAWRD